MENMIGKMIFSISFPYLNGKIIESVYEKAFPDDPNSTLWIVKLQDKRGKYEIYENEMY